MHIDRLTGIRVRRAVYHGQQALRVDIESEWPVGRRSSIREISKIASDGDVVHLIGIRAGKEGEIGARRNSRNGVAVCLESRIRVWIEVYLAVLGVCSRGDFGY